MLQTVLRIGELGKSDNLRLRKSRAPILFARRVRADYALRIDMTKAKPKDQLLKRGRKSDFRPEYILIAKACARFGAIEDEIANELNIGPATLDRWKQK